MSENRSDNRTRIPESTGKGPSWIAIGITLVLRLFPVSAILLFLKLRAIWRNKKLDKFRHIFRVVGSRPGVSLDSLAKVSGMSRSDLVKLLEEMLSNGYFGSEAYIDHSRNMLIVDKAAAENMGGYSGAGADVHFDFDLEEFINMAGNVAGNVARSVKEGFQSGYSGHFRKSAGWSSPGVRRGEEDAPEEDRAADSFASASDGERADARPSEEASRAADSASGNSSQMEIIAKLRMVNDQIMDPEVSRKIDRIIDLTNDIYAVVEQNPNRADQVRRFMNYYLPTTIKLLGSYGLMERQSYQGENIVASRRNIEEIMDTLVHAFEKQLDQLFAADAVDISSDIQVLETMIAKDGLTQQAMQLRL